MAVAAAALQLDGRDIFYVGSDRTRFEDLEVIAVQARRVELVAGVYRVVRIGGTLLPGAFIAVVNVNTSALRITATLAPRVNITVRGCHIDDTAGATCEDHRAQAGASAALALRSDLSEVSVQVLSTRITSSACSLQLPHSGLALPALNQTQLLLHDVHLGYFTAPNADLGRADSLVFGGDITDSGVELRRVVVEPLWDAFDNVTEVRGGIVLLADVVRRSSIALRFVSVVSNGPPPLMLNASQYRDSTLLVATTHAAEFRAHDPHRLHVALWLGAAAIHNCTLQFLGGHDTVPERAAADPETLSYASIAGRGAFITRAAFFARLQWSGAYIFDVAAEPSASLTATAVLLVDLLIAGASFLNASKAGCTVDLRQVALINASMALPALTNAAITVVDSVIDAPSGASLDLAGIDRGSLHIAGCRCPSPELLAAPLAVATATSSALKLRSNVWGKRTRVELGRLVSATVAVRADEGLRLAWTDVADGPAARCEATQMQLIDLVQLRLLALDGVPADGCDIHATSVELECEAAVPSCLALRPLPLVPARASVSFAARALTVRGEAVITIEAATTRITDSKLATDVIGTSLQLTSGVGSVFVDNVDINGVRALLTMPQLVSTTVFINRLRCVDVVVVLANLANTVAHIDTVSVTIPRGSTHTALILLDAVTHSNVTVARLRADLSSNMTTGRLDAVRAERLTSVGLFVHGVYAVPGRFAELGTLGLVRVATAATSHVYAEGVSAGDNHAAYGAVVLLDVADATTCRVELWRSSAGFEYTGTRVVAARLAVFLDTIVFINDVLVQSDVARRPVARNDPASAGPCLQVTTVRDSYVRCTQCSLYVRYDAPAVLTIVQLSLDTARTTLRITDSRTRLEVEGPLCVWTPEPWCRRAGLLIDVSDVAAGAIASLRLVGVQLTAVRAVFVGLPLNGSNATAAFTAPLFGSRSLAAIEPSALTFDRTNIAGNFSPTAFTLPEQPIASPRGAPFAPPRLPFATVKLAEHCTTAEGDVAFNATPPLDATHMPCDVNCTMPAAVAASRCDWRNTAPNTSTLCTVCECMSTTDATFRTVLLDGFCAPLPLKRPWPARPRIAVTGTKSLSITMPPGFFQTPTWHPTLTKRYSPTRRIPPTSSPSPSRSLTPTANDSSLSPTASDSLTPSGSRTDSLPLPPPPEPYVDPIVLAASAGVAAAVALATPSIGWLLAQDIQSLLVLRHAPCAHPRLHATLNIAAHIATPAELFPGALGRVVGSVTVLLCFAGLHLVAIAALVKWRKRQAAKAGAEGTVSWIEAMVDARHPGVTIVAYFVLLPGFAASCATELAFPQIRTAAGTACGAVGLTAVVVVLRMQRLMTAALAVPLDADGALYASKGAALPCLVTYRYAFVSFGTGAAREWLLPLYFWGRTPFTTRFSPLFAAARSRGMVWFLSVVPCTRALAASVGSAFNGDHYGEGGCTLVFLVLAGMGGLYVLLFAALRPLRHPVLNLSMTLSHVAVTCAYLSLAADWARDTAAPIVYSVAVALWLVVCAAVGVHAVLDHWVWVPTEVTARKRIEDPGFDDHTGPDSVERLRVAVVRAPSLDVSEKSVSPPSSIGGQPYDRATNEQPLLFVPAAMHGPVAV